MKLFQVKGKAEAPGQALASRPCQSPRGIFPSGSREDPVKTMDDFEARGRAICEAGAEGA